MSVLRWNNCEIVKRTSPIQMEWVEDKVKFPQKLWELVNSERTPAIKWAEDGASLVIDYDKLLEYFSSPESTFVTKKISSFTRQLNIYGFKKVSILKRPNPYYKPSRTHYFFHDFFIQGREDLLQFITRKSNMQGCYQIKKKQIENTSDTNKDLVTAFANATSIHVLPPFEGPFKELDLSLLNNNVQVHSLSENEDVIEMKLEYIKNVGWVHIESTISTPKKIE